MRTSSDGMHISVLGKELVVACPPEERDALRAAAQLLDSKMREIQDGGKVIGAERCAIMAGLNITHELLQERVSGGGAGTAKRDAETERRVQALNAKIERVLRSELAFARDEDEDRDH